MAFLPKVVLLGGPDVHSRLDLMQRLADKFNVSAIGSQPALGPTFAAAGFEYRTYRLSRRANPVTDVWGMIQIAAILRRLKPQILHTFATKPSVWGRLAARLAGVPVVIGTLPGLGSLYSSNGIGTRLLRSVYQPLQRLACNVSDVTIFQNHEDRQQFIAGGVVPESKAALILGSGVATDQYCPARVSEQAKAALRAELGIEPDAIVVTMISRVNRTKGASVFVDASREIRARLPQVHFLLVGPQDNGMDRLNQTQLRELSQVVQWTGPRNDIRTVLAISDVFALPSAYREGIPRVLLEAASMGLPIVTTDAPGCNEVVVDGLNGFLVPPRAPAALSQALLRLIERAELRSRFGGASRRRAVERFDLSILADETSLLYWQLLERGILARPPAVSRA